MLQTAGAEKHKSCRGKINSFIELFIVSAAKPQFFVAEVAQGNNPLLILLVP